MAGCSQGALSGLENDKAKPAAETIANLLRHTDIDIRWLLTGEGAIYISSSGEGGPTGEDPEIIELLEGAKRVLKSGNPIAFDALERNIRYFDHAVAVEERLRETEAKMELMSRELVEIKALLIARQKCEVEAAEEELLERKAV